MMYYWKIETTWKQNKLSDCWKLTKITTVKFQLHYRLKTIRHVQCILMVLFDFYIAPSVKFTVIIWSKMHVIKSHKILSKDIT